MKIKNIKKIDRQDRYDLTVNETRNFFANGILIHNTSQRVYYGKDKRSLSIREKVAEFFGCKIDRYKIDTLVGTRRVIISDDSVGFHSDKLREDAAKPFLGKLHPGETVYYEVIGWDGDKTIMPNGSSKPLSEEEQKKYGGEIVFSYGLPVGEFDIYVYRITISLDDGRQIDLPWEAVKKRCAEMHIKSVPECLPSFIFDGDYEKLEKLVEELSNGDDIVYPSIPREGVCIRADRYPICLIEKNKGLSFKLATGIAKNDEGFDIEDAS